jgi:nicotinamide-nucleotide amidase
MDAIVLSIGTELTRGELVNTNAAWIAEQLTELGFVVTQHVSVDDDSHRITSEIRRLCARESIIVMTGGLGPTSDDRTSAAVASAAGVDLVRDEESFERIKRRFERTGRVMPDINSKQADVPLGARVLVNTAGTAPGFELALGAARLFVMPGVPSEMKKMFTDCVVPAIVGLARRDQHQIHLRTFGLPESQVASRIADLESQFEGVTFGYRAHFPEIEVKILARGKGAEDAELLSRRVADLVRDRLGDAVYGEREHRYAEVVGRALRERGLTLALAESCTGGLLGALITDVPGSSDYLVLDAVTYSNASKTRVLGVSEDLLRGYGAVSAEAAAAMAEGARRVGDAALAISITGIAGPGGGTEEKPVGTVYLGLARESSPTKTKLHRFTGDRERIRTLAAYQALDWIHRTVTGRGD